MSGGGPRGLGFWTTVFVLLRAARRRSVNRFEQQRRLLRRRGSAALFGGTSGLWVAALLMAMVNVGGAFAVRQFVREGGRVDAERTGHVLVAEDFYQAVRNGTADDAPLMSDGRRRRSAFAREALRQADRRSEAPSIEARLRETAQQRGVGGFVSENDSTVGMSTLANAGRLPAMLGSLVLVIWGAMLVFSGEGGVGVGAGADIQRRRHPVWEWLFSHPVPVKAVFLAEMISPLSSNPMYIAAPFFVGALYANVYSREASVGAAFLAGVPLIAGAAALGRAIEIAMLLRLSGRSRGASIGLMNFIGFTCLPLLFLGTVGEVRTAIATALVPLTALPWPWLGLMIGSRPDGSFSFLAGLFACWSVSIVTLVGALSIALWAVSQGLVGPSSAPAAMARVRGNSRIVRFRREPLFYKEYLWFIRDRSALVEAVLIPLTVAGAQLFQFRNITRMAGSGWHVIASAAIFFGTYFIAVLGPRSLMSEGSALWLSLTWPRGLESLLKAKARLWSIITSAIVLLVLAYAVTRYPSDWWRLALVALGWIVFCRSMADKSVTLVTTASESGQPAPIPWGRRMAAQLGMVTFAVGVLNQEWSIAFMGIVYSYATAAAMWQYFRTQLPFLYDKWSETLPAPPTLMHAMVAISVLADGGGLLTGLMTSFAGSRNVAVAMAIGYALSAILVAFGVSQFLAQRGVPFKAIRTWRGSSSAAPYAVVERVDVAKGLLLGAIGGVSLGLLGLAWTYALRTYAIDPDAVRLSTERMAAIPHLRLAFGIMAVGIAPFAEEYLFRGLLFQSMYREWSDWRATAGSALFFTVMHPPAAWVPVGLLAVANAELFKRTGRLGPAIALHMVYNAVVVGLSV